MASTFRTQRSVPSSARGSARRSTFAPIRRRHRLAADKYVVYVERSVCGEKGEPGRLVRSQPPVLAAVRLIFSRLLREHLRHSACLAIFIFRKVICEMHRRNSFSQNLNRFDIDKTIISNFLDRNLNRFDFDLFFHNDCGDSKTWNIIFDSESMHGSISRRQCGLSRITGLPYKIN